MVASVKARLVEKLAPADAVIGKRPSAPEVSSSKISRNLLSLMIKLRKALSQLSSSQDRMHLSGARKSSCCTRELPEKPGG